MNVTENWRIISRRILSLRNAAELYGLFQCSNTTDIGSAAYLSEQVISILEALKDFRDRFSPTLPQEALDVLAAFVARAETKMKQERDLKESRTGVVLLVGFESHMSALLAGTQEIIRTRTERALLQLRWQLIVDESIREKWREAFKHERLCEGLGAAHLIGHGICAFKVRAGHSETDLIINEPLEDLANSPAVDGFVSTEWKRVDDANVDTQLDDARGQLALYQQGALSSMTLSAVRYVIAVSLEALKVPLQDVVDNGVTYRQINLVVDSIPPSKEVKKRRSSR